MNDELKIQVGDQTHEVPAKTINLIFRAPALKERTQYPGLVSIDSDASIYHGERVQKLHADTERLFRLVFTDWGDEPVESVYIRTLERCYVHVLGLVDMSLKLRDLGIGFAWIKPESHLHPAHQLGLMDAVIQIMRTELEIQNAIRNVMEAGKDAV